MKKKWINPIYAHVKAYNHPWGFILRPPDITACPFYAPVGTQLWLREQAAEWKIVENLMIWESSERIYSYFCCIWFEFIWNEFHKDVTGRGLRGPCQCRWREISLSRSHTDLNWMEDCFQTAHRMRYKTQHCPLCATATSSAFKLNFVLVLLMSFQSKILSMSQNKAHQKMHIKWHFYRLKIIACRDGKDAREFHFILN